MLACDAAKRNDWSAGEQWLRRAWGNSSTPDASSATGHGAGDEGWKDPEGSGRADDGGWLSQKWSVKHDRKTSVRLKTHLAWGWAKLSCQAAGTPRTMFVQMNGWLGCGCWSVAWFFQTKVKMLWEVVGQCASANGKRSTWCSLFVWLPVFWCPMEHLQTHDQSEQQPTWLKSQLSTLSKCAGTHRRKIEKVVPPQKGSCYEVRMARMFEKWGETVKHWNVFKMTGKHLDFMNVAVPLRRPSFCSWALAVPYCRGAANALCGDGLVACCFQGMWPGHSGEVVPGGPSQTVRCLKSVMKHGVEVGER